MGWRKALSTCRKRGRRRHEVETDEHLKDIWKREAEIEMRIAKLINGECDALVDRVATP